MAEITYEEKPFGECFQIRIPNPERTVHFAFRDDDGEFVIWLKPETAAFIAEYIDNKIKAVALKKTKTNI